MTYMMTDVVRKPVLVRGFLHRRLRTVAFNYDVKLQDLVDAIIESVLNDKVKVDEIVQKLKK